jgi:hypothetical protein
MAFGKSINNELDILYGFSHSIVLICSKGKQKNGCRPKLAQYNRLVFCCRDRTLDLCTSNRVHEVLNDTITYVLLGTEAINPVGTPQNQQPFLLRVLRALDQSFSDLKLLDSFTGSYPQTRDSTPISTYLFECVHLQVIHLFLFNDIVFLVQNSKASPWLSKSTVHQMLWLHLGTTGFIPG